jgi:uncharacterized oxidoreductase
VKTSGNTILITGGATGIGLELARALADSNDVIICGRRRERLEEAKAAIPSLHIRQCDVANDADRRGLAAWLDAEFPQFNVLVNNAGVQHRVDLTGDATELAKAEEEIAINLLAPIHLTALLLPQLRRQPAAAILNVSSGLAFAPLAFMPVYCATKAALHSLTMSLRYQLRDSTVRVVEVIPPIVTSELGSAHRSPEMNRTAMPTADAVAAIVEGMARDDDEITIGGAAELRTKREALFPFMNRA